jgi:hypothetical protein
MLRQREAVGKGLADRWRVFAGTVEKRGKPPAEPFEDWRKRERRTPACPLIDRQTSNAMRATIGSPNLWQKYRPPLHCFAEDQ